MKILSLGLLIFGTVHANAASINCNLLEEKGSRYLPDAVSVNFESQIQDERSFLGFNVIYTKPGLTSFMVPAYFQVPKNVSEWEVTEQNNEELIIQYDDGATKDVFSFDLKAKSLNVKYYDGIAVDSEGTYSCNVKP